MALSLSNCANNPPPDTSTGGTLGPFDEHGRYVEAWADDPSKWRRSGGTQHETKPQIAKNDEVPLNSVPLAPAGGTPKRSSSSLKPVTLTPLPPARTSEAEVVKVAPKRTVREAVEESPKPKPKTTPVKVKPKPKPKPKAVRYTVKKGDTLSGIASKTGASVSAIKSENGISGSMIHPGQTLTIPKR